MTLTAMSPAFGQLSTAHGLRAHDSLALMCNCLFVKCRCLLIHMSSVVGVVLSSCFRNHGFAMHAFTFNQTDQLLENINLNLKLANLNFDRSQTAYELSNDSEGFGIAKLLKNCHRFPCTISILSPFPTVHHSRRHSPRKFPPCRPPQRECAG